MSGDRDFNKKIDIDIIAKISLTEKRFYIFIKLENDSEAFIINNLINIKKEEFFFINYQFARSLENKININMMTFLKLKEYRIFNRKKTYLITHAIYFFIKIGDHYIQINTFYVVKIAKYFIIIKRKWLK